MHKMLSDVALTLPNVTLRLNTTVVAYTGNASISVKPTRGEGAIETLKSDLIIGADGVKSLLRSAVIGREDQPRPTGDAAFRAIVPAEKLLEHEDLKEFIEYPHMTSWMGPGRHIMGYCIVGQPLSTYWLATETFLVERQEGVQPRSASPRHRLGRVVDPGGQRRQDARRVCRLGASSREAALVRPQHPPVDPHGPSPASHLDPPR